MKKNNLAKTNKEFDKRFDNGEDIHDLLDMSQAQISRPQNTIKISVEVSKDIIHQIDTICKTINVDRGSLLKVWIYEKVKQETTKS